MKEADDMQKTHEEGIVLRASEENSFFRKFSFFWNGLSGFFFGAALFLNGLLWTIVFVRVGFGEGMIVLRYSAYFGIDLTGTPSQSFLIPFIATIFLFVNAGIARIFVGNGVLFPGIFLSVLAFLVQIAAGIEVLALILIN